MATQPAHATSVKRPKRPSAADVAKYMLVKKGSLTGFQLEKLLFYCQAWSLAVDREPLFDDEIRAFMKGPVVPNISQQRIGKKTVLPSHISGDVNALTDSKISLIDAILDAYGGLSGDELADLSHSEAPWRESWNGQTSPSRSAVVSTESIQAYYSQLLAADDETRTAHHVPIFDHPNNLYVTASDFDWLVEQLNEDE